MKTAARAQTIEPAESVSTSAVVLPRRGAGREPVGAANGVGLASAPESAVTGSRAMSSAAPETTACLWCDRPDVAARMACLRRDAREGPAWIGAAMNAPRSKPA